MKEIYLVEDEKTLSVLLKKYLSREGYQVTCFDDGNEAMAHIEEEPHLWILDINLPGCSGYDIIKGIKKYHSQIPVIFISARNDELDRVVGLEMGSEDYLPKPFLPRELVIRTNKLISRIYGIPSKREDKTIQIGEYIIYKEQRRVQHNEEDIQLTSKEFDVMSYLIENKNSVLSREQILEGVWGIDYFGSDRVVDDTIRRLRKKLSHMTIETIYGYGYKWVIPS